MRLLILIITTALLFACSPRIADSIHEKEVNTESVIDTTIITQVDSAIFAALLECDSLGRVRIKELVQENGRLIRINAVLQNNILKLQAAGMLPTKQRTVYKEKLHNVYVEVPKPYPVPGKTMYKQRWWQTVLCWIGLFYLFKTGIKTALNWKSLDRKSVV